MLPPSHATTTKKSSRQAKEQRKEVENMQIEQTSKEKEHARKQAKKESM